MLSKLKYLGSIPEVKSGWNLLIKEKNSIRLFTTISDPLHYGQMEIASNELPDFSSGKTIFKELHRQMETNEPIDSILKAPQNILGLFTKIFPEVAKSNDIGACTGEEFRVYNERSNDITIDWDDSSHPDATGQDIYIGGPAALFGAALQSRSGEAANTLYGHDGIRGISNWKGSASYFHIRDAIPVYYWPDNHGIYSIAITVKHAIQKRLFPKYYAEQVTSDPNWNKLRLHWGNLFAEPSIFGLFAKNQVRAFKDVGFHTGGGGFFSKPEDTTAYTTTAHAYLTHEIVENLKTPKPVIMKSNKYSRALHLHLGQEGVEEANGVFKHLSEIAGDLVNSNKLTSSQIVDRGYDPNFVKQALEFPNDGYIPPYVDGMLEEMIEKNGGQVKNNMRLKKILVSPTGKDDIKVTGITWEDKETGKTKKMISKLLGSPGKTKKLGPSVKKITAASSNILQKIMWASGSSCVFLVKVDNALVSDEKMARFRDHVDAHNKHIVRLAEKQVCVDGKPFTFFALQTTGGGHFPAKDVHAEAALNVLLGNVKPLLGLDKDGIEFDIVTVRSCARGIGAKNVFAINAPASNMVAIYGIGGIGMTTMAPNALLMKAIMGLRTQLASGEIQEWEFQQKLKNSQFDSIPHWEGRNPFCRNYAQFVDNVDNPKYVAHKMPKTNQLCSLPSWT